MIGRLPVAARFGLLFVAGIGLYLITSPWLLAGLLVLAVGCLLLTGAGWRTLLKATSGLLIIVGAVVIMTGLTIGWPEAIVTGLRLLTLCLFAGAISLVTSFSEMLSFFDRLLAPTARIGLNPARMSLALSLTVRFIPELRTRYLQVREAQLARGLPHRPTATLIPLVVRTLHAADQISEAIDARCYDDPGV